MGIRAFNPLVDNHIFHPVEAHINGSSSCRTDATTVDVPVLIIGGGPAGLLQGHLLSRLGGWYQIVSLTLRGNQN
jgi:hypothetical protein